MKTINTEDLTSISVYTKDKREFNKFAAGRGWKQRILFRKMIKVMKKFKPELEDMKC